MFSTLPTTSDEFMGWGWPQLEPYYAELRERPLSPLTVDRWLVDWTSLSDLIEERRARLIVALDQKTADPQAKAALDDFLDNIEPQVKSAENELDRRLLDSGLEPAGLAVPLRTMRVEAELFNAANLPLFSQETKLGLEYGKIVGAQTVNWGGEELTLAQLAARLQTPDRAVREKGWHLAAERYLQDREAINDLWVQLLRLRQTMAANAGYEDYRAFRWQQLKRFDYTPQDAGAFHQAIEAVVVPAARRVYERYQARLGLDRLRPWDVEREMHPYTLPALQPYERIEELEQITAQIFHRLDPVLGGYFETLRAEGLLDLKNYKGKAPAAYMAYYPSCKRPFIFMNAVGAADDIKILLHESGHAFHVFEICPLRYYQQRRLANIPAEFAEVGSMAMEFLASAYLAKHDGGFFSTAEAARWRVAHMEETILFWPYIAVVDAFQHWVYTHPAEAADPANCDAKWAELWQRFIPAIDYSGFEEVLVTGWQRKVHIFRLSFYYIEYGLALLGALQVWRNALADQAQALKAYRYALSLGGTRPLPELFAAAGARFAFDQATLAEVVGLLEDQIAALSDQAGLRR